MAVFIDARGGAEAVQSLSGLGDLMLTCASLQSRNMSFGYALGQGQALDQLLTAPKTLAEGVWSTPAVRQIALTEVLICRLFRQLMILFSTVQTLIPPLPTYWRAPFVMNKTKSPQPNLSLLGKVQTTLWATGWWQDSCHSIAILANPSMVNVSM